MCALVTGVQTCALPILWQWVVGLELQFERRDIPADIVKLESKVEHRGRLALQDPPAIEKGLLAPALSLQRVPIPLADYSAQGFGILCNVRQIAGVPQLSRDPDRLAWRLHPHQLLVEGDLRGHGAVFLPRERKFAFPTLPQ